MIVGTLFGVLLHIGSVSPKPVHHSKLSKKKYIYIFSWTSFSIISTRRSLYAEYAVCIGHQLVGGTIPVLKKKKKN